MMVMPYFPLGNLHDQHQKSHITVDEAKRLLHQGLVGIEYMHKNGVVHRDIAPRNILVKSRGPRERPHLFVIVLTDFGLAKRNSLMQTQCGTYKYAAKEVFSGNAYRSEVDIWSLGVVVLELVYGLPGAAPNPGKKAKQEFNSSFEDWCDDIATWANDWDYEDGDPMMEILVQQMLKVTVRERATATECLKTGEDLELWPKQDGHTQSETPTAIRSGQDESTPGVNLMPVSKEAPSNLPSDDDYDIASDVTEIAPSRRQDKEGVQYCHAPGPLFGEISPELTPGSIPPIQGVPASKRPTTDSFTDGKGKSKRSRVTVFGEADEHPETETSMAGNLADRGKGTVEVCRS